MSRDRRDHAERLRLARSHLRRADPVRDLVPPGSSHTTLALDDPDFPNWLHFLSTSETRRLLREAAPRPA